MAKKRKKKQMGGIFVLLLLFIIAIAVLFTTPVFCIQSVEVVGNSRISAEEIHAAAEIPQGINSFRVSLKNTKKKVESLPYVLTAKVRRRLPDKIRIMVTERTEIAMVRKDTGYAVIDITGRVLRHAGKEEPLPILSGAKPEKPEVGKPIVLSDGQSIENHLNMIEILEREALLEHVKEIFMGSSVDISLITKGGMRIYLSGIEDMDYKLKLLKNITKNAETGISMESGGVLRWTNEGQFSYRQSEE